ncbi:MAG: DNA polymerase III subunit chi [Pseudomonadota bacterium]
MKVDFWLLSRDPVEKVVAQIAGRVLAQDARLLVVSDDAEQRAALSKALWSAGPESFLANGDASAAGAERQPILLSAAFEAPNGASHAIFADGRYRDAPGFERVFLLFDEATRQAARETWVALEGREGLERIFMAQENGKWVKKG